MTTNQSGGKPKEQSLSRARGKSFEYRILYKLKELYPNSKRIPSSGAASGFKGDIWSGPYLVECKKTGFDSYRIAKETLKKLEQEAKQEGKIPLLVFALDRTGPYVVMSYDQFKAMHNM